MKSLLTQIVFRNQTSFLAVSALNLESQVRISTKTIRIPAKGGVNARICALQ